jgi:ethanolamine permease
LLIFAGVTLPHFQYSNLITNALPNGYAGIFASIPFAIWFFLAIEGLANLAEETIHPQKNIRVGLSWTIATLVVLCVLTFVSATGVKGWANIVYTSTGEITDSPLPLALAGVVGNSGLLYHLLVSIGLLGLIASFHGIILAAGRATFEFGRVGYAPKPLGNVHSRFKTPAAALWANMGIGVLALFTGKTGEIITIACFGALTLYSISMVSLLALRRNAPQLVRPFKVPLYPYFPLIALICSLVALLSMCVYNAVLALLYFGMIGVAYAGFYFLVSKRQVEVPARSSET